jgi:hypothetical protein
MKQPGILKTPETAITEAFGLFLFSEMMGGKN